MRLQEEYIKRHSLKFSPIYHVNNANIILKLHSRPQVILNINWDATTARLGHYVFNYIKPNHNGYLDGNYFLALSDDYYYQYDEYFSFIRRWVKKLEFTPVKFDQVKLAVWEMFLYCFDGWLAERGLEELVFQATDLSLPAEVRTQAVDSFLCYLEDHDSLVLEIYNSEFRKYEYHYANWLVELILNKDQKC